MDAASGYQTAFGNLLEAPNACAKAGSGAVCNSLSGLKASAETLRQLSVATQTGLLRDQSESDQQLDL